MTVADAARPRRPARPALRWLKPADAAGSAADSTGGLGAAGAGECGGAGSGAGECCGAAMADQSVDYPVTRSEELFAGRIWDVLGEEVALPDGQSVWREFVAHPGAAAVIAINDQGQVLLQRQYRHPVAMELWEPPAGLLDVPDEPPIETARRELVEEADLEAADWRQLVSFLSTPGGTSEAIYVYLARGLTEV
ncbi:MAG: NUDIX hydrolase, partial [Bifidobacteriaceae bacterium]|nr:NUDIX hydrolase [Bifidobacteriaceae bacterium]